MKGKLGYTQIQDEFLMSNFANFTNQELASSEMLKGKTPKQILSRGWHLNLHKSIETYSRALSEGCKGKGYKFDDKTELQVCNDYENGLSESRLGRKYSTSRGHITGILIRHDTKKRTTSEANYGEKNGMYGKPAAKGAGYGKVGLRKDIGHYVRSSWEANYCRYLQYFGVYYEYEKHKFKVDKLNSHYWPDFYIPEINLYIEIKGYWHPRAKEKFEEFKKQCPDKKIIVIGEKEYKELERKYSDLIPNWE